MMNFLDSVAAFVLLGTLAAGTVALVGIMWWVLFLMARDVWSAWREWRR